MRAEFDALFASIYLGFFLSVGACWVATRGPRARGSYLWPFLISLGMGGVVAWMKF